MLRGKYRPAFGVYRIKSDCIIDMLIPRLKAGVAFFYHRLRMTYPDYLTNNIGTNNHNDTQGKKARKGVHHVPGGSFIVLFHFVSPSFLSRV